MKTENISELLMLKHLMSTKMFIASIIFFLLTVGGSLYYYHHEVRLAKKQSAETKAFLQRLNERNAARASKAQTYPQPSVSIEGTRLPNDATEEAFERIDTLLAEEGSVGFEDILLSDETLELEQEREEYSLSPSDFAPETEYELRKLVEQKLLEQGVPVRASFMENDLVYPLIKNVVYVEWDQVVEPNGQILKHLSLTIGLSEDVDLLDAIHTERRKDFSEHDIPSHLILIPYEEGGIDPYQFLN